MTGRVDVLVVLGCAVREGRPSGALSRRLDVAVRAVEAGLAPRILVSGGARWGGVPESEWMRGFLSSRLPGVEIACEPESRSTVENALFSARWLRREGARRVLLSTCRWHLPRALADFRACGVDAVAPPNEWLAGPPETFAQRLRERLATPWDRLQLAVSRARHLSEP